MLDRKGTAKEETKMPNEESVNGKEMKTGFEKKDTCTDSSKSVPEEIQSNNNINQSSKKFIDVEKESPLNEGIGEDGQVGEKGREEFKAKDTDLVKEENSENDNHKKAGTSGILGSLISLLGSKRSFSLDSNSADEEIDSGPYEHNEKSLSKQSSTVSDNDTEKDTTIEMRVQFPFLCFWEVGIILVGKDDTSSTVF